VGLDGGDVAEEVRALKGKMWILKILKQKCKSPLHELLDAKKVSYANDDLITQPV